MVALRAPNDESGAIKGLAVHGSLWQASAMLDNFRARQCVQHLLGFGLLSILGCSSTRGPSSVPPASVEIPLGAQSSSSGDGGLISDAAAAATTWSQDANPERSAETSASDGGPTQFDLRCRVERPIRSQDRCVSSADCAPSSLCHAPSCVARAKAPVRPDGGVMCTMMLVCKSIDVGRCDCVDGVCALVSK